METFEIPEHWPTKHPHVFGRTLTHEQWLETKPHVWREKLESNDLVVFEDHGYGFSLLALKDEDGKLIVADWTPDSANNLVAGVLEDGVPAIYIYRDLEYYGEAHGGLFKKVSPVLAN